MDEQDRGATAADVWEHGATALRAQLAPNTFGLWFQGVRAVSLAEGVLTLAVPSFLAAERIRSSYTGMLSDTLRDITGQQIHIELTVETDTRPDELSLPSPTALPDTGSVAPDLTEDEPDTSRPEASGGLNPRYTFDQFVIGASNRFAHAAALSVAEAPGRSYNPLFIYGGVGLGKTHLLHAIGHHVKALFRNKRVRYVQTESFMNAFIDAIHSKTMPTFKRRFRDLDVLLIDDIQFLARTEQLQEEFFHTFNQLHNEGGQIVISSDAPPKSIAPLENRLRSRFEWGLITDVQVPEFETRLAILRKKAEAERLHDIPNEVLAFIASNVHDNVRELEGALIRVAAYSSLHREPLTDEIAHQVLADLLSPAAPREITPQLILDETAKMFGWTVEDLCGKSRRRPLVTARQIGMYVFRELTGFSYPRIAEQFGGRDHTTVMYAVEKIKQQMTDRHATFDQVNDLISRIKLGTGG